MHYKNGRIAKVGDPVIGTTYNRNGTQAGILVGLTPEKETCNCRVALMNRQFTAGMMGYLHKEDDELATLLICVDYSACKDLLHADDAMNCCNYQIPLAGCPSMEVAVRQVDSGIKLAPETQHEER